MYKLVQRCFFTMEKNHIKMWYDIAKVMETQEKEKKYCSEKFVKCI